MTTTDYWTNAAAASPRVLATYKDHALNWRLMLAFGLNILAWTAIFKVI